MAFSPLNTDAAISDNLPVTKEAVRDLIEECQDRLGDLPADYSIFGNCEVIALGAPGVGPAPASDGTAPINFAGRALGDYTNDIIEIDGGITLTQKEHSGRRLDKETESASTLYLDPTDDRDTGVQKGFSCAIWRDLDAGDVQIVSSMNNGHPGGHTRVTAGGVSVLICKPDRLIWRLVGETEL